MHTNIVGMLIIILVLIVLGLINLQSKFYIGLLVCVLGFVV